MRGLLFLCAVVATLVVGTSVAAFNAFAARTSPHATGGAAAQAGAPNAAVAGPSGAGTPSGEPGVASPVAAGAATQPRSGSSTRAVRPWDATAPAITIDPDLIDRLDQALVGVDGHVGVAVKDLGSGRGAVLDGNTELQAASLYKLPVLYAVFAAGLSMTEELPITEEARAYDSGTMELGVGETLQVSEALERMVTLSDNTSAVMLGGRVGSARVNQMIDSLGLDTTHYSLERMTTSALDMVHLLELMARGRAVSPAASADMVHLLLRQRVNDRLPRLLPDDVQIAHKTGNLPGVVNDVGILYGPNSTVAVAALVSDTDDETAAATAIAKLGQAAYEYFEGQSEGDSRPTIPSAPTRPIPPVWREPRPVPTARPTVAIPVPTRGVAVDDAEREPTPAHTAGPTQNAPATPGASLTPTLASTPQAAAATPGAPTPAPTAKPTLGAAAPSPTSAPGGGQAHAGGSNPPGNGGGGSGQAGTASSAAAPTAPALAKPTAAPTVAAPPPTARPTTPPPAATAAPQRPASNPTATAVPTATRH